MRLNNCAVFFLFDKNIIVRVGAHESTAVMVHCSPVVLIWILRKHGREIILCIPNRARFIDVVNSFSLLSSSKFDLKSEGRNASFVFRSTVEE
jgi:hypothetical protein